MWVGPLQTTICELLKEFDIPTYSQYVQGRNIHDDGVGLFEYTGTIPNLPLLSLLDTHLTLSSIDSLVRTIDLESDNLCPNAEYWDSITVHAYAKKKCWTKQAQSLINSATRMVLGYDSDQVPLLYFLYYCRTAGGTRPLLDSDGGGQDSRMHGGTIRLLTALKEKIEEKGFEIFLDCAVVKVDYTVKDFVHIECSNGKTFRAKRLIMSCPPSCLGRMQFTPTPPAWKQSLWHRAKAGCFIKVVVMYATSFWRSNGFSGSCVCEHSTIARPISGVFDYCDASGSHAALCCFVCGNTGEAFSELSETNQRHAIVNQLVRIFGQDARDENVIDFVVMDWLHDPDGSPHFGGGGCPVDISAIGYFREHVQHLRSPLIVPYDPSSSTEMPCIGSSEYNKSHEAIFFAGTETAVRWCGYMEGAVESGQRAAREVLLSLALV